MISLTALGSSVQCILVFRSSEPKSSQTYSNKLPMPFELLEIGSKSHMIEWHKNQGMLTIMSLGWKFSIK